MNFELTEREKEVYNIFVFENVRIKDAAKKIHLSEGTIKAHLGNIYNKLGINSIPELIRFHYRNTKQC